MTIKLESDQNNLLVIRASGVLTRAESDGTKKEVVTLIKGRGKINLMIIIEADFANLEAFANWDDDHDDEFIQKNINRMAIVGDLKWRDNALLFFLGGLLPFSIQYFKSGQEAFAKAWLG